MRQEVGAEGPCVEWWPLWPPVRVLEVDFLGLRWVHVSICLLRPCLGRLGTHLHRTSRGSQVESLVPKVRNVEKLAKWHGSLGNVRTGMA